MHKAFLVETEALKPEIEAETEALTIQAETRPRPRPSELETERRPKRTNSEARPSRGTTAAEYCASRRPPDRRVKTEATSHIHIIPRTDVVLKRCGGSLELTLNRSGIFKHNLINFIHIMLKCLPTRQRRLLPRPRPMPRPRPSVSRPRPRSRRSVSRPRRDRGV